MLQRLKVCHTPISVRIARSLEETLAAVQHETLLAAGGRVSGSQLRAVVSDFLNVYGDDPGAVSAFADLPIKVKQMYLRRAAPARTYSLS